MARYRKIDPRVWNDEKFRGLSDQGKLVFFMLLTHPNMTALGAMRATVAGLAEELGWATEAFRDAFQEGLAKGMAEHDPKACLVALPNFLKYNPPESPNVVKAWLAAVDLLPECALKTRVIAGARAFAEGLTKGFAEALPEVFAKTMPIQEQEQEQEQENTDASPAVIGIGKPMRLSCPHEQIRSLYAEILPELPAVKVWSTRRQTALKTRWSEMAKDKGWTNAEQGLAWFRKFFETVAASDFLMGRGQRGAGYEGWRCDFDKLMEPSKFVGVIEGKYANREAA